MASGALATAVPGLSVAIGAIAFLSVNQPGALNSGIPLDAVVDVMIPMAALAAFNSAVACGYVHLCNGGGAAAAAACAGNTRISTEVVIFFLCASVGVLQLFLFHHPAGSSMDGAQDVLLGGGGGFVHHVSLLACAAALTFFLSMVLIVAHVRARSVKALTILRKMTLAAALVTVVLTLVAAILAFPAE